MKLAEIVDRLRLHRARLAGIALACEERLGATSPISVSLGDRLIEADELFSALRAFEAAIEISDGGEPWCMICRAAQHLPGNLPLAWSTPWLSRRGLRFFRIARMAFAVSTLPPRPPCVRVSTPANDVSVIGVAS